jgi:transcriptional regulator of arginine metabolism
MGIASDIDLHISNIILGTIAGDDTILLIPREVVERKMVKDTLLTLIEAAKS